MKVDNYFGTEDHIEKSKSFETINIDNIHIFLNDFVFTIFVTPNDFDF